MPQGWIARVQGSWSRLRQQPIQPAAQAF